MVVHDALASTSILEVIDTIDGAVLDDIPGGTLPSWSPDGAQLALATPAGVDVFDVRSGALSVVAADTTLVAPPLWARTTTLVLSTAARRQRATPAAATVELVNRQVDARYALPGAPTGSTRGGGVPRGHPPRAQHHHRRRGRGAPAPGAPGSAQSLPGHLQALGFAGEGILVAVSTTRRDGAAGAHQRRRRRHHARVALGAGTPDLQSVRVALDGRRLVCLAVDALGRAARRTSPTPTAAASWP